MNLRLLLSLSILSFFYISCDKDDSTSGAVIESIEVVKNPHDVAPLTAELRIRTKFPVKVSILIKGKNGPDSDIFHEYTQVNSSFTIPVLGLYPIFNNTVVLSFMDQGGLTLEERTLMIQAPGLMEEMPEVEINQYDPTGYKKGMNLVNYFGHTGDVTPQRAFMFDAFGDIRWFLNFEQHPQLGNLFFDNGMVLLQNGNLVFGDGNSGNLYEIDFLGEIKNTWSLQGYGFHHHVLEKPNGNFLVTVNDPNKTTVEDVIIELDRSSGAIINTWDLNLSIQNTRRAWETDIADLDIDWFHANAIEYSAADDCIIVSSRTQGVVKLDANNEVKWILAPHKDWVLNGNAEDLNDFLLHPIDAEGNLITDDEVKNGNTNHPDFEWSWYQHSPILTPDGTVMIFDNGDNRNYIPTGFSGSGNYSRAVEYRIDEAQKTIQQVWSYGKERLDDTYSRIVSKVNYYRDVDHVLFTPGAVLRNGENYGKVIEIDHATGNTTFEATIKPPQPVFNITFHNVHRMELY